jgi:glycosyltransferase involved in cell wall biosynthesis
VTTKVALLTTSLAHGGAEAQVAALSISLVRRAWRVDLISLLPPTAYRAELKAAGVVVHSLGMAPGEPNPLGFYRLLCLLRRLRPQVLHAHMFHANLVARLARMLAPVPVVISTLHSAAESGRDSHSIRWRDRAYRWTDRLPDATVAVCQAVAERHAEAGAVRRARLRVIPNGVDTESFRPDAERRASARRALGLGAEFAWLAAGRLMWKKGYEIMLRAAASERRTALLIAGSGPQEKELKDLACQLGVNARFLGQRDDIADLMRACDGFVQSSLVEGLPVVLLEACASGLPAVVSKAGGTGEAVLDGRTGFVVPRADPLALAGAMRRVEDMPEAERQAMGKAARARCQANFELSAVVSRWEDLYKELLASWT